MDFRPMREAQKAIAEAAPEVVVGVGDFRTASEPSRFLATYGLGSCVAVLLYDWRRRTGALLHVMMPDSSVAPEKALRQPFAYVDTAMPKMFKAIADSGGSPKRTRCCLVGGASMIASPAHFEIGKRNVLAVRKALWKEGVFIDREEIGGNESRSVRLDLKTGGVTMRKGGAPEAVLLQPSITSIVLEK
jgi:chemotaxis protein CheD